MTLSVNHQMVGGLIDGPFQSGREPLPWILITIRIAAMTWDRHGNRATVPCNARVVIQGEENVKMHRQRLRSGVEVFCVGQVVPAHVVVADSDVRGPVCLASILQFPGADHAQREKTETEKAGG